MLAPGFPADESESTWVPALQCFVKALARRNPHVALHVISFQYPYQRRSYGWNGVTVHALAGKNRRFPLRCATWLKAAWMITGLRRSHAIVVLHSHWLAECTYVASWAARLIGAPHIATIHGQDALAANPYLRHLRFDRMTVTCLSENAANAFFQATGRKVDGVIPIGVDTARPDSGTARFHRNIDVLGVGSLTPVKDFRSFLEIVSQVRAAHPRLRAVIIGEGPEVGRLQEYITALGLDDSVRLAGRLPRDQVLESMRAAKILLHTAQYEGQGYVFLEALSAGMRVVCRNVGYTGGGAGVYHCGSNSEMVDTLKRLLAERFVPTEARVMSVDCTAAAFEKLYGITEP